MDDSWLSGENKIRTTLYDRTRTLKSGGHMKRATGALALVWQPSKEQHQQQQTKQEEEEEHIHPSWQTGDSIHLGALR